MKRFVAWIQGFVLAIGAPGLFLVTFLDSSFITLPEIADLLLVVMVIEHPYRVVLYAAMATAGSVGGCFSIYWLARKGGETFVRRRLHERHIDRTLDLFQRYGVWALIVPAVLPPPAPFKIFVLMAGVAGLSTMRFLTAIAIGRGARYFAEGLLAVLYGRQAITFLDENLRPVAWVTTVLIAAGAAVWIWRVKRRKV